MPTTSQQGYYNSGDVELRYMEIGIALKAIDRMFPGKVPFCIPALMPNENKSIITDKKIVQKSKTNILTDNAAAIDVSNIEVSNAIYIEIPKELTCLPAPIYDIDGTVSYDGNDADITINNSHMSGSGLVDCVNGIINVNGSTEGHVPSYNFIKGHIKGTIKTELNKKNRYIQKNSKWLIAFIGGDPSMPQVICRLPDQVGHTETPELA